MIRLQDLTPAVYYNQSRDFQFIGRLFDIVLNHVKTNADNLYNLPIGDNMNESLLNLLAFTLGFQSKHNYNSKQLLAICSVLPMVLRNKGSLNAITIAVNSLLYAEGIQQALDYQIDNGNLTLYLPTDLSDLTLLRDLLNYLIPAGMSCTLVKEISEAYQIETIVSAQMDKPAIWVVDNPKDSLNRVLKLDNPDEREKIKEGNPMNKSGMLVNIAANGTPVTKKRNNGGSNNG